MKGTLKWIYIGKTRKTSKMDQAINLYFMDEGKKIEILKDELGIYVLIECEADASERYYVLEVTAYNSSLGFEGDISLKLANNEIGILSLGHSSKTYPASNMTLYRKIAILLDKVKSNKFQSLCHEREAFVSIKEQEEFKHSYSFAFIKQAHFDDYKTRFLETSALWGGFCHGSLPSVTVHVVEEIELQDDISLPTSIHSEKLLEAVNASTSFDRFLKKYHLLELLYDYWCIAKLRNVNENLDGFREIMQSYSSKEIDSLTKIIKEYTCDILPITNIFYELPNFESRAKLIFVNHAKDSSPIKESEHWDKFINLCKNKDLNYSVINADKSLGWKKGLHIEDTFKVEVLKLASYFIYRIRCSIAHTKIGEFIFNKNDEKFISSFAEPLLDNLLKQILKNPDLKAIIKQSKKVESLLNAQT